MASKEELKAMGIGVTVEKNKQSKNYSNNENKSITEEIKKNFGKNNNSNIIARIIKIIAIVCASLNIIFGMYLIIVASNTSSDELLLFSVVSIIVGVISAVFIYGLGEIIQLLQDIKDK